MSKKRFARIFWQTGLFLCVAMVFQEQAILHAQVAAVNDAAQLDSLVAPIALYPDPLLTQALVACTYPIEIIEAAQWLQQNPGLTGSALEAAAAQQNWDPSIQALLAFPDVLHLLSGNIRWSTDLGNEFLAQQANVMDAVQRMRSQAQAAGTLNSNDQVTVSTAQPVPTAAPVVVIQPANPQVVYVPVYDPVYVWGRPVYPYPVLVYPSVVFSRRISYGTGIFIGATFNRRNSWGGWGPNWGNRTVVVNRTVWSHEPARRRVTLYSPRPASSARPAAAPYAPPRATAAYTAPQNGRFAGRSTVPSRGAAYGAPQQDRFAGRAAAPAPMPVRPQAAAPGVARMSREPSRSAAEQPMQRVPRNGYMAQPSAPRSVQEPRRERQTDSNSSSSKDRHHHEDSRRSQR